VTVEAFKRQLEAISSEYRASLPKKLAEIDALWSDLVSGAAKPDHMGNLQRELHSIAGSAKTFGVSGVSEAAAAAELFLEPFSKRRKLPNSAQQAEFARLLDKLKNTAR
jgi:chemotaxis protein histidine kinase CheA